MFRSLLKTPRALWSRIQGARPIEGALGAAEFERAFHRERARVDRTGGVFSMVVFTPQQAIPEGPRALAEDLLERMRIYDSLGLLDSQRVSMLLPETPPAGAWSFADDAVQRAADRGLPYGCEVYGYPLDWQKRKDEGASSDLPVDLPGGDVWTGTRRAEMTASTALKSALPAPRVQPAEPRPVRDLAPAFVEPLPIGKRLVDIAVAGSALLILSPLLLAIAALVKLTSPGPVIFTQLRAGRGGVPFRFYKFRSMYVDAEARKAALRDQNEHDDGPIFKMKNDPRITPLGKLLRRASLDELPQLLNVLKGDMTLIGPRPPTLDEVEGYEPWQRKRLDITGGLTCIWQVSGRSEIGFEDWVRMDLEYTRRRSLLFDLKLLVKTVGAVLTGRGAY